LITSQPEALIYNHGGVTSENPMSEAVSILLDLLLAAGERGLPLAVASRELEMRLSKKGLPDVSSLARATIETALDEWLIDKVIDDPLGFDVTGPHGDVWFLRVPQEEKTQNLQSLPEVERKFLRLLHAVDIDRGLGMMREDVAIAKLREMGFDINYVPWIDDRLETQYEWQDGEPVKWYCLIPEYLRTEEHKKALEEMDDKEAKRVLWFMEEAEREEREEARARARRKRTTKAATKKKPPKG